nr:ribonuclease H-like domain-containing protein [Tanacetum cinerariifolium]
MVTCFRVVTDRPTEHLNLHVSLVSSLPKSYRDAFSDPNWQNAMRDEYHALIKNKTWTLVPRPSDTNIVRCLWIFHHKYMADGMLSHYKARLVANSSTQLEGVDVDETFSPVVKSGTIMKHRTDTAYLLLYVDDIVLTTSSKILLQQIIRSLHPEFAMTDLDILDKAHMVNCYLIRTSIDTESKLRSDGDLFCRCIFICMIPESLIIWLLSGSCDWAGCPSTRSLTSGYYVFLGNKLLSWSSKHQPMLSRSSAEVEYHGVANAVTETCWLRNLLCELHTPLSSTTLIYCDNVSAIYLSCNLVQHQRTKHIEIDIHFVHDLVAACEVRVLHVSLRYQFLIFSPKAYLQLYLRSFIQVCKCEGAYGLLRSMWCMYDAYNEHGDYPVARLEIDSFDETAYVVIVMFDESSEEQ